jgi:transposase
LPLDLGLLRSARRSEEPMQGKKDYQPKLFSVVDIESRIPKRHLLRRVDEVLELNFLHSLTAPYYAAGKGRPSIDPEVYVRMLLVQYLYCIESDRQLCEELEYNLAYRWFCRLTLEDPTPDHSSMTRIRDRLGEKIFQAIFEHIVKLCEKEGLVKGKQVMMDATIIRANASLYSLEKIEDKDKDDSSGTPTPSTAAEVAQSKLFSAKSIRGRTFSNETHVSKTDPDAKLSGKANEPKGLRYKIHNSVERGSRVILDTHVTDGATMEGTLVFDRVDAIKKNLGYEIGQLTADRGYGYGENLTEFEKRGIQTYVPNFHSNVGDTYDPELFVYDEKEDKFLCAMGFELTPANLPSYLETQIQLYRMLGAEQCRGCRYQARCYPGQQRIVRGKRLTQNLHHKIQAETKAREQTPEFKEMLRERMWKVEGLFSEAKHRHGLHQARYRRRWKVQIQAYLVASTQNLKRLLEKALPEFISILLRLIKADPVRENSKKLIRRDQFLLCAVN